MAPCWRKKSEMIGVDAAVGEITGVGTVDTGAGVATGLRGSGRRGRDGHRR